MCVLCMYDVCVCFVYIYIYICYAIYIYIYIHVYIYINMCVLCVYYNDLQCEYMKGCMWSALPILGVQLRLLNLLNGYDHIGMWAPI